MAEYVIQEETLIALGDIVRKITGEAGQQYSISTIIEVLNDTANSFLEKQATLVFKNDSEEEDIVITYLPNMTWDEWVNSKYNTFNISKEEINNYIILGDSTNNDKTWTLYEEDAATQTNPEYIIGKNYINDSESDTASLYYWL